MSLDENMRVLVSSCQSTLLTLDSQIDILSKIGMAALQVQNMEVVSQVMNRTNCLKAHRDKVETFQKELSNLALPKQ